mmetsp:Transcript_95494/g.242727  ORF Transcript_95494/g.242727 Transcript_95494/m.242727 type:complete len:248 (+) Transcript_95494:155-898(+)
MRALPSSARIHRHSLELQAEIPHRLVNTADDVLAGCVGDVRARKLELLLARGLQGVDHVHEGHTELLRWLEHVVGQLPHDGDGASEELNIWRLRASPDEEASEARVLRHPRDPFIASVEDVQRDLRGRERQHQTFVLDWLVLLGLHHVPHHEQHLCADHTRLSQLIHHPEHGLCPVEIRLAQMQRHDRKGAEAVGEHCEGRRSSVAIGVAKQLPSLPGPLQRLFDFLADLFPPVLRKRIFAPWPSAA